ncbi:hypothetical protein [Clostridium magnum]|uniref:Uncharacterized protein n=1 Tax=Clostridium magnum DSM 2767 TaxID=1121326 RepID=A0A161XI55_9CLOT|nr:hypothetical protein [Clostridium magnum]KZL94396.1 hypothetical protein CLMAG_14490 [Clostridium magnum DSM 2767]SHJ58969.1 hypothetical protein SAMN02745944_06194 [Clostridium magnum DSM 2767]
MNKFKAHKLKYKNIKICLVYCSYKNFEWYAIKNNGIIILCLNNAYSRKVKSKLLHAVIKRTRLNT